MKTQVFHYFREIGNGLIFVQLIERALNQQEMHDMIQAAPFRRQFPRIHIKEGERYESKEGFKIIRSNRDPQYYFQHQNDIFQGSRFEKLKSTDLVAVASGFLFRIDRGS